MNQITIVNLKDVRGRGVEVVGRPSILGNPFKIGRDGSRSQVINKYKKWLWGKIQSGDKRIINELKRLKQIALNGHLVLGCWCAPQACHAEVIKSCLEWAIRKGGNNEGN